MGFMVSIDRQRAPSRVHGTIEEALAEAARLRSMPHLAFHPIRILEEVAVIEPGVGGALSRLHLNRPDIKVSVGAMLSFMERLS